MSAIRLKNGRFAKVTDKDDGAKSLSAIFKLGLKSLRVGFQDSAGERGDDSGLSVVDVVTFHEFGLGVPRRSIVADWVDEMRSEIDKRVRAYARLIVQQRIKPETALEQLGLWAQGSMRERMSKGIPPPLAQSTIDRKGSSTPLILTGQTRAAITYKVGD